MFKIICVTDRKLCNEDFLIRIEKVSSAKPDRIMFRDKLCEDIEYTSIASKILEISSKYNVPCSMYRSYGNFNDIHMTMSTLRSVSLNEINVFNLKGVSVHSVEEAKEAEQKSVDYIIAGHIFTTQCKPDLEPRGLDFLHTVVKSVNIPVYAIGGINVKNIGEIVQTGASGACIMSGFMKCENPLEYIRELREEIKKYEVCG